MHLYLCMKKVGLVYKNNHIANSMENPKNSSNIMRNCQNKSIITLSIIKSFPLILKTNIMCG
jgi:hypothetical protein